MYNQALKSPEKQKCKDKMDNICKHKVWHLIPLPQNKNTLRFQIGICIKHDGRGNVATFKAHLVVQEYRQIKGDSYNETFAPFVSFAAI